MRIIKLSAAFAWCLFSNACIGLIIGASFGVLFYLEEQSALPAVVTSGAAVLLVAVVLLLAWFQARR